MPSPCTILAVIVCRDSISTHNIHSARATRLLLLLLQLRRGACFDYLVILELTMARDPALVLHFCRQSVRSVSVLADNLLRPRSLLTTNEVYQLQGLQTGSGVIFEMYPNIQRTGFRQK